MVEEEEGFSTVSNKDEKITLCIAYLPVQPVCNSFAIYLDLLQIEHNVHATDLGLEVLESIV
jgi:hypothetical protein